MEYDIDGGNTQRDGQGASDSRDLNWAKFQEIRSGKYADSGSLYGSYNFLLEAPA